MSRLDVSDLIGDPDFASFFKVERDTETVTTGGMAQFGPTTYDRIVGVIENNNLDLSRLPEMAQVKGSIVIYTKFRLTNGGGGYTADKVYWAGNWYTVMVIEPWYAWGEGYVRAVCNLVAVTPDAIISP